MHAGAHCVLIHVVPFFQRRDSNFVVVDADTIHPFLLLRDIIHGNQGFGGCLLSILREVDGGERDLEDLTDRKGLSQGQMIKGSQLFRADIIQAANAVPVFLSHHRMFQV